MTKSERILALINEGTHPADAAAACGSSAGFGYKVAAVAGVTYERRHHGPARLSDLRPLSPWHEALGRWIDGHLRHDFFDAQELADATGLTSVKIRNAASGVTELTVSDLLAFVKCFGEPAPAMIFERPRFETVS